jgi:hypothetical protein
MLIIKTIIALSLLVSFANAPAVESKLRAFETDGCTLFVDGTSSKPDLWKHCCISHDLRYWFGGTKEEMDETDSRLKLCVEKAAGPRWAGLIYTGVRAGHYSPIKNKYQWAWAWSPKRSFEKLTAKEIEYVIAELKGMQAPEVDMESFLKENFPLSK